MTRRIGTNMSDPFELRDSEILHEMWLDDSIILEDVGDALTEAGIDPDHNLEAGDAVRALTAERDDFRSALQTIAARAADLRDLVDAVREELGLLDVHDDDEVLIEIAKLKALRVPA